MTTQIAVVLADTTQPGILETLPPWALALAGLILLAVAVFSIWIKKKMDDDSSFLGMMGMVCGIGGLFALWKGIFGS